MMPDNCTDLEAAHRHSIYHRAEVEESTACGCFYCESIFPPQAIGRWIDEGPGTALCPHCGIDAVIGDKAGYPITPEFLAAMKAHWF